MKKKTAKPLLLILVVFLGSLFLLNCERDKSIVNPLQTSELKKISINIQSWNHWRAHHPQVSTRIEKFRQNHVTSKITSNSQQSFYINEEEVQIIEGNGYSTYTFSVLRDEPQNEILENYMYKEFSDGSYKQFLLTYYYIIDSHGNKVLDKTNMGIQTINDQNLIPNKTHQSGDCLPHFEEVYDGFACTIRDRCTGNPTHEIGDPCDCEIVDPCIRAGAEVCEHTYRYVFNDCSGGGDTGNIDNPNYPNNPPTGGGGSGGGDPDDGDTDAIPLEETFDYVQGISNCINDNPNLSLSQTQVDWLNTASLRYLIPLWEHLDLNSCGQEALIFGLEAIDALIAGAEIDYEDQIINKLTNDCANEIFTQIEDGLYSTNPIKPEVIVPNNNPSTLNFSQMILHLFNDHITDLKMENGTLSNPNSNAVTSTFPGGASIKISDNYLNNATKLSIARSIIHELVHAYILRQYSMDFTFKQAVEQYGMDNGFNINGTTEEQNRFHHEFMGKYVDAMAFSLYEWDKEYGSGSGNSNVQGPNDLLGWDYYYAMAFGGLFYEDSNGNQVETDSFIALIPNQNDRQQIKNIILNEQSGNSNAQSTTCN